MHAENQHTPDPVPAEIPLAELYDDVIIPGEHVDALHAQVEKHFKTDPADITLLVDNDGITEMLTISREHGSEPEPETGRMQKFIQALGHFVGRSTVQSPRTPHADIYGFKFSSPVSTEPTILRTFNLTRTPPTNVAEVADAFVINLSVRDICPMSLTATNALIADAAQALRDRPNTQPSLKD